MPFKCGLLGEKLGHSVSPEIHRRLGGYEYRLYEKTPSEVEDFLRHGDYDVLNVTIPYKRTAFALCHEVSPVAEEMGNVNVVVKRFDGRLFGDNTDAFGFGELVRAAGTDIAGKKCVVLGSGGAGTTAAAVLGKLGAGRVVTVSRGGEDNYGNLERHADAALLVNATPVGMFPRCDAQPVSLDSFPRCEAVIDLIYNPSPTKLLASAADRGMAAVGGALMLEAQARLASRHMNANIYLYGPPGSGKSTFARKLARRKNMPLVDLDLEIERSRGRKITEIFAAEGEDAFREAEKAELRRAASGRGQIVALGGGALLDPESRRLAEETGRVVFIECPEEELKRRVSLSAERPLLAANAAAKLEKLLARRREHYGSFSERIRPEFE
jgi:shikimate dehydrogenase